MGNSFCRKRTISTFHNAPFEIDEQAIEIQSKSHRVKLVCLSETYKLKNGTLGCANVVNISSNLLAPCSPDN